MPFGLKSYTLFIYWLSLLPYLVLSSQGDSSNLYRGCYHTCHFNNCTEDRSLRLFEARQSAFEKTFQWTCEDECKYHCMWYTTEHFMEKGYSIPQFHGKWPFFRIFGLQEPASVFFSILNLYAHLTNVQRFRKVVPPTAPLYGLWHFYFLISVHAWIWSAIFHAKDTPLTERMDYFSAFSMVLFSLVAFLIRVCGKNKANLKTFISLVAGTFFFFHVFYLSTNKFDYGYNMKINVLVATMNCIGWLWWSYKRCSSRLYVRWCRTAIGLLAATAALEMLDFPPILWVFDAHSLWHLSTSPLPYFWCRFIEGDCYYLLENSLSSSSMKKSV